ncbi:MAG: class I SAM-dependent methyltransferase [Anaerolineae bacterium]
MSTSEFPVGAPEWWNARYLAGDTPWDTGIVPPEVVALVGGGALPRGWALDLGCGSGVPSRYLAQHGFAVIGIDLAFAALARARRSAAAAGLAAFFCLGDVADLGFLRVRATLAIDIGCFHAIPPERRPVYVTSLAEHLLPGAFYLLYAFEPATTEPASHTGVGPAELARFAPAFVLRWAQHGLDRDRPAAWYLWQRAA